MIECRNLSTAFGRDRLAVEDVSLTVDAGESYCLLGAAESGKTTIVDAFRGVTVPTAGQALISGMDCLARPLDVRRKTLFVTPKSALVDTLSIRENVEFFARVAGHAASRQGIENSLRRVGLPEASFDAPVGEVDRREATLLTWLAVGLIRQVAVVVLDEPTRDLDARSTAWAIEGLREIHGAGAALLVATSDPSVATAVGSRIGLLRAGRKDAEYRSEEIANEHLPGFHVQHLARPVTAPGPERRP